MFPSLLGCQSFGVSVCEVRLSTFLALGVAWIVSWSSRLTFPKPGSWLDDPALLALLVSFGAKAVKVELPMNSVVREDFKILDRVVERVPVLVMNNFLRKERSSEVLFHDDPVDSALTAGPDGTDLMVSVLVDSATLIEWAIGTSHERLLAIR